MRVQLAYGRGTLPVEAPDGRAVVIEPTYVRGLPDERVALRAALRKPTGAPPLRDLVKPGQRVTISVCDITRPMPSDRVLPAVLEELSGVPRNMITVLVATGTHRGNSPEELVRMLGADVVRDYRVVNHDALDKATLRHVGQSPQGIPVWLDREWLDADVRITTGFVEPHMFAGFSGGPKLVAPGVAGLDTVMELHSYRLLDSPKAIWGVTDDNPLHTAIRGIAEMTGVHFTVDVTLNKEHDITGVYAGRWQESHPLACRTVRKSAMRAVAEPFDVVVTTNSGYPLDLNLYQAVKGMSAAAQIVKPGGTIIIAAECWDGIPEHGEFKKLLYERDTLEELMTMISQPGYRRHDQWEVQILGQVSRKAKVYLKNEHLSADDVRRAHVEPTDDVEATMLEALRAAGPDARVCLLPQGPQTIPYLSSEAAVAPVRARRARKKAA